MGKKFYNIIYLDPPWHYSDKCRSGERGVEYKYPVIKPKDLKRLDVGSLAAEDCVMFMWVTAPQLPVGLELMQQWGFTYKTFGFVWVKTTKAGDFSMGMGHYTRSNAELVILGTRGRPKRVSAAVRQVVSAPRGKHSAKPEEVRERIVDLMGDVPRVELFAKDSAEGWDCIGNEIDGQDIFDVVGLTDSE